MTNRNRVTGVSLAAASAAGLLPRSLLSLLLVSLGCQFANPADSKDYEPSRLPLGELTVGVWLPAGLDEFRFGPEDQQRLAQLGTNQIEWLQRSKEGDLTAEEIAMEFCNRSGLHMPVYYEAPGFSPYDKLRNWATRTSPGQEFDSELRQRILGLKTHWQGAPGFAGYLIGHEDYSRDVYEALARTVVALGAEDPLRPAITVGNIDSYPKVERFLDAFFPETGPSNLFQHEHYVFHDSVPTSGRRLQKALEDLVEGYGRVARRLQGRNGRWHAIVQAHSETRNGDGYSGALYRKPTAAELRVQVGLALARGAAGVIYFLYSSGTEEVLNQEGELRQRREYEGVVDRLGMPTDSYYAIQRINEQLREMSPVMEELRFHGGYAARQAPTGVTPLSTSEDDLDLGLFGDGASVSHVILVNRQTDRARVLRLELTAGANAVDAVSGDTLEAEGGVSLEIEAGGFRLLAVSGR